MKNAGRIPFVNGHKLSLPTILSRGFHIHVKMFNRHPMHPLSLVELQCYGTGRSSGSRILTLSLLPGFPVACGRTPLLQRRDRVGFKPTSLLGHFAMYTLHNLKRNVSLQKPLYTSFSADTCTSIQLVYIEHIMSLSLCASITSSLYPYVYFYNCYYNKFSQLEIHNIERVRGKCLPYRLSLRVKHGNLFFT